MARKDHKQISKDRNEDKKKMKTGSGRRISTIDVRLQEERKEIDIV